jgi:hypothetical protein
LDVLGVNGRKQGQTIATNLRTILSIEFGIACATGGFCD